MFCFCDLLIGFSSTLFFFLPLTCTVNPTLPSANLPVAHIDMHTSKCGLRPCDHLTQQNKAESSYIRYWHCSSHERDHCSVSLWCLSECGNKVWVPWLEERCCPSCSPVDKIQSREEYSCPAGSWREHSHISFQEIEFWKTEEVNNVFSHPSADSWIYQIPSGVHDLSWFLSFFCQLSFRWFSCTFLCQ